MYVGSRKAVSLCSAVLAAAVHSGCSHHQTAPADAGVMSKDYTVKETGRAAEGGFYRQDSAEKRNDAYNLRERIEDIGDFLNHGLKKGLKDVKHSINGNIPRIPFFGVRPKIEKSEDGHRLIIYHRRF